MAELTLIKKSGETTRRGKIVPGIFEKVVGIKTPSSKTMWQHGYRPGGRETEVSLSFTNTDIVGKIAEFYDRTLTVSPENEPIYDCHMMAWYALSSFSHPEIFRTEKITNEAYDDIFDTLDSAYAVSPALKLDEVQAGESYAMFQKNQPKHSILGIGKAGYSLSVFGAGGAMIVAKNEVLMRHYRSTSVRWLTPLYDLKDSSMTKQQMRQVLKSRNPTDSALHRQRHHR